MHKHIVKHIVLRCSGAHIKVNYVLNGRCTGTSGISGGKRVNRPKNVQTTVSLSQSLADDECVHGRAGTSRFDDVAGLRAILPHLLVACKIVCTGILRDSNHSM